MAALLLEDVDWVKKTLTVRRFKKGKVQIYPLLPEIEYALHNTSPSKTACSCPQLFVSIRPPYRKLTTHGALNITIPGWSGWVTDLVQEDRILAPCSRYTSSRKSASLKQIGDFLGHRDYRSALSYAKFDPRTLRKVADFRLDGLL